MSEPVLTRSQARRIDELATRNYGLDSLVLMENAGRGCVDLLVELGIDGPVVLCCGKGNNGGDGFVMARHLQLRGFDATVLLWADPDQLQGDAATNFRILERARIPWLPAASWSSSELAGRLGDAHWIVDALLGTGAQGEPRPPLDRVIDVLNETAARRLAVDLPSGLDSDDGTPAGHTFRADHTATFVAAKRGFLAESAGPYLGTVHVRDIGAPPAVLDDVLGGR